MRAGRHHQGGAREDLPVKGGARRAYGPGARRRGRGCHSKTLKIGAGTFQKRELIMTIATSTSLFKATRRIIVDASLLAPEAAHSQAGVLDFETCQNLRPPLNTVLFACSKVIGDQSQPSEIKLIALLRRANVYELHHDYDKALSDLDQAFQLGNVPPEFYALRSRIYREKGDKANAIKDLTRYMELTPNPPITDYYSIANEYFFLGDYDRAIDYYTKLINNDNPAFANFSMRARAYSLAGENAKALQDLEAAHPLDVGTFNADMARIFIRGGQLEKGMVMANEAIAHYNNYAFSYEGRGLLEEALGQKDKAIEDFRMALFVAARVRIFGAGDEAAAGLKRLGVSP
jgi:tetratricopeptide (TPR) repeat protein